MFGSADVSVPAGTFASTSVVFPWPAGGETVEGAVDISMKLKPVSGSELSTTNNTITISTRALTITFFMAQEYFDELSKKQNRWGTYNAVDWLRTQFKDMHDKFAQSVYPATPDGYSPEHRITVVDRLGRLTPNMPQSFGSFGSEPGQFNVPAGVAVDSQSRIYVTDLNNNRIQAFTSQGNYIAQFTGVSRPRGIDVDSTDRIIVADTGNYRAILSATEIKRLHDCCAVLGCIAVDSVDICLVSFPFFMGLSFLTMVVVKCTINSYKILLFYF